MMTPDDIARIAIAIYLVSLTPVMTWLLAHYRQRPNCETGPEGAWLRRLFGCTEPPAVATAN
jgi:hypothetical protein